ncbi:hypothetical protein NQ314_001911 [Rhamnusium bicolor]|uniref:Uncharacterized protein n=1 Tax=Rhamnusium bicolor TaxID=1586634 RepID=A0AAV8ZSX1_9CUCU|nr:hypothetical protein NQ314_001911 [Rhamnusium bicolor]
MQSPPFFSEVPKYTQQKKENPRYTTRYATSTDEPMSLQPSMSSGHQVSPVQPETPRKQRLRRQLFKSLERNIKKKNKKK